MSNVKILIVGRSASGKDALASILHSIYNLEPVLSCTTRPQRNADDDSHIFVNDDEADLMIPKAVAVTNIDHARYFAMPHQVEAADYYIIDPNGIDDVTRMMPDTAFTIVYVATDETQRIEAARARAKEYDSNESIVEREHAEKERFDRFEGFLLRGETPEFELAPNVANVIVVRNDYEPDTLYRSAAEVYATRNVCNDIAHDLETIMDYYHTEPDFESISPVKLGGTPISELIGTVASDPNNLFFAVKETAARCEAYTLAFHNDPVD